MFLFVVLDACPTGDSWCSSLDETEKLALEAITALFHQLDDDKNGNIDLEESNEVSRRSMALVEVCGDFSLNCEIVLIHYYSLD